MSQVINLEDESDRWQWVCPRGHRTWEPTNHHYWCSSCANSYEFDGVFYELRNLTTGELVERDNVRLVTSVGSYEELHG